MTFGPSTGGSESGGTSGSPSGTTGGSGSGAAPSTEPSETLACEPAELCAPAFGEGQKPCPTCLIDDFEDGDGMIPASDGRYGPWYGYQRTGSISPVGTPIAPEALTKPRGSSEEAMHVRGDNEGLVLLGVDLVKNGDDYGTYDASAHQGITIWLKNDAAVDLVLTVLVSTRETTNQAFGGSCEAGCDAGFSVVTLRGGEWTAVSLPWSVLSGGSAPFSPSALTLVQFVPGPGEFDFWVDDPSFF